MINHNNVITMYLYNHHAIVVTLVLPAPRQSGSRESHWAVQPKHGAGWKILEQNFVKLWIFNADKC
jgi:hypothetical protein